MLTLVITRIGLPADQLRSARLPPHQLWQVGRLRSFGSDALVLFSGDAFHPSLLSTVTQASGAVCCT